MKVVVVAEYYPREAEPTLGIWAHRQAVAAREAGAEVRVLVLQRLVPPKAAFRSGSIGQLLAPLRQSRRAELDGIQIEYVRYIAPPRQMSYASWGRWAARPLRRALRRLRKDFPYDLLHAHYAAPAGDACRRADRKRPLVISAHGGDVLVLARHYRGGERTVRRAFKRAGLTLANSRGTGALCLKLGADEVRVVHLGTDLPQKKVKRRKRPALVTVGNLVARKRHADVLRALWLLRDSYPELRYVVIGDGPERKTLKRLVKRLELSKRVKLLGALDHEETLKQCWRCSLFVMPSTEEAFGVAYIEAMAGRLPAIGSIGEPGPEEIVRCGEGMRLVPPGDIERLAARIDEILRDEHTLTELGLRAQNTVKEHFSWKHCGEQTVDAYREALR